MLQDDMEKMEMRIISLLFFNVIPTSEATEESHQDFLDSKISRKAERLRIRLFSCPWSDPRYARDNVAKWY